MSFQDLIGSKSKVQYTTEGIQLTLLVAEMDDLKRLAMESQKVDPSNDLDFYVSQLVKLKLIEFLKEEREEAMAAERERKRLEKEARDAEEALRKSSEVTSMPEGTRRRNQQAA